MPAESEQTDGLEQRDKEDGEKDAGKHVAHLEALLADTHQIAGHRQEDRAAGGGHLVDDLRGQEGLRRGGQQRDRSLINKDRESERLCLRRYWTVTLMCAR